MLRGFRVAHVFNISETEGDPLPEVVPELLTGDAPAALWEALAAQVAVHGYTLVREVDATRIAGRRTELWGRENPP